MMISIYMLSMGCLLILYLLLHLWIFFLLLTVLYHFSLWNILVKLRLSFIVISNIQGLVTKMVSKIHDFISHSIVILFSLEILFSSHIISTSLHY